LLKSTDIELKYEWAMKYYTEENYNKALPLFDEIIPLYRGSEKSEELNYRYAYCNYYLNDLLTAGYLFQKFYNVFPASQYAEESMFMSAYCYYSLSPVYSLDQSQTNEALKEFKKFRTTYPTSTLVDSAINLSNELYEKLDKKAFENAKLFVITENYKASIVALQNFLKDHPNTKYEKEANFLILKSAYLLAMNSVIKKKEERINDTIDAYYNFVDNFDDEKYLKESEQMYDSILKERDKLMKEDKL
jgi:outer membrane protein assembly factor BamD